MFLQQEMNGRVNHPIDNCGYCENTSDYAHNFDKKLMPFGILRKCQYCYWIRFISVLFQFYLKYTIGKDPKMTSFIRTV